MKYSIQTQIGDKWIDRAGSFSTPEAAEEYGEHLADKEREVVDYRVVTLAQAVGGITPRLVAGFAAAIVIAASTGCGLVAGGTQGDFMCYSDGEITEHHVGIRRVSLWSYNRWEIVYDNGHHMHYLQRPGETCGMDAI